MTDRTKKEQVRQKTQGEVYRADNFCNNDNLIEPFFKQAHYIP